MAGSTAIKQRNPTLTLQRPSTAHGASIRRLVSECAPLDVNSTYAYLLLCEHFADTCVHATLAGRTLGFLSAYTPPGRDSVLFVWQVAVAAEVRGQGLAKALLLNLLSRERLRKCTYLETTVSPSNAPSRALFYSLARRLQAPIVEKPFFLEAHFEKESHESETLISIGPFLGAGTKL